MDKSVKTRNTSTRLASNNAEGVERAVIQGLPNWRSYPRVLRVLFGQVYRFASLAECVAILGREIDDFNEDFANYVDKAQLKELEKFADNWFKHGVMPKTDSKPLSFTQINQQLFYEATMGSNAAVAFGSAGSQDVKMAAEGGYGNHLAVERLRHNTMRKADAEQAARDAVEVEMMSRDDGSDMFGGKELEYSPFDSTEEN